MAIINTIKNKDDKIIYPQTHAEAVFTNDGTVLQDKIDLYLTTDEVGTVEDVSDAAELQANRVTTINEVSTDTTYPSAGAVYRAIIAYSDAGMKFIIPESGNLPDEGETSAIYLVPNEGAAANNIYDEWMYINSTWEIIGSTQVDLSNYYTKTETDETFAKKSVYNDTNMFLSGGNSVIVGNYNANVGRNNSIRESYCLAAGQNLGVYGPSAVAEGDGSIAKGSCNHAEGYYTISAGDYQHVQGTNNIEDTENRYAHIVGNGTYDDDTSTGYRSNAHTLDWSGNAWYSGDVYVGSTSGTNKDEGSKKLATEEYIDNKVATALYITDLQEFEEVDS